MDSEALFEAKVARAVKIAMNTDIIPPSPDERLDKIWPDRPGVRIDDYLLFNASDAAEFGISLLNGRFSGISDVAAIEQEWVIQKILEPIIRAVLKDVERNFGEV